MVLRLEEEREPLEAGTGKVTMFKLCGLIMFLLYGLNLHVQYCAEFETVLLQAVQSLTTREIDFLL